MIVNTFNNVIQLILPDTAEYYKINESNQYVVGTEDDFIALYVVEHNTYYMVHNDSITYKNVEVPDGIIPYKYCYTSDEGFYENPDFVEPPKSTEARVTDLEERATISELELDYRVSMLELGLV